MVPQTDRRKAYSDLRGYQQERDCTAETLLEELATYQAIREVLHIVSEFDYVETLRYHLKNMNITQADLIRLCDPYIGRRTIQRMFTSAETEKVQPKLRTVIALCIILKLNGAFSADLVEKAGYHLRKTPEEDLLRCILERHYNDDIDIINNTLEGLGYAKLGG